MNNQTNMAQLRSLEELKISLVHAGFEPERIEDQHLPVRWEGHYLCRISGRAACCTGRSVSTSPVHRTNCRQ